MVSDELVIKVARAFAKAEGFGKPGAVPTRAHNPGDLTDDGDVGLGTIHTSGEFGAKITIYANDTDGWAALYRKVRRMLSGASHTYLLTMTIADVAIKYSGDPNWGKIVARDLGVEPSTTLLALATTDLKLQAPDDGSRNA
jgi:hypothetical protein